MSVLLANPRVECYISIILGKFLDIFGGTSFFFEMHMHIDPPRHYGLGFKSTILSFDLQD
jgi:hypothetical protein